jgi:uncharacterized protein (DUF736 family)
MRVGPETRADWANNRGKSKRLLRKLDDRSFNAPLRTYLFDDEDGDGLSLCVVAVSTN